MKRTNKTPIINSRQGIVHACRNDIHHPNRKCIQSHSESPNQGIHVHDISYISFINIHQPVVMANLILPKDGIRNKSLLIDTCHKKYYWVDKPNWQKLKILLSWQTKLTKTNIICIFLSNTSDRTQMIRWNSSRPCHAPLFNLASPLWGWKRG